MPPKSLSRATENATTPDTNEVVKDILHNTSKTWKTDQKWLPLYDLYKDLHRNPGVSGHEDYAADSIERQLQSIKESLKSTTNLTLKIHRDIGRAESGPGVVAVLKNTNQQKASQSTEPKPVVLLRADIDALPVEESTGVEYASTIPGAMHACGHDMHITTLIAAIQLLIDTESLWSGTVIACFQPSEEPGTGAQAMINDGLYERHGIPTPDFVFGAHVTPEPAGTVSMTPGVAFFRADSWEVTIKGKSGHASRPEATIDPIVTAAYAITRLQTIVSRSVSPQKMAVLTVSQINAGDAPNVIPGSCKMKINVRGGSNEVSGYIESEMRRIITNEVHASDPNAKADTSGQEPERSDANPHFRRIAYLPLLENKPQVTDDLASMFSTVFQERFNGNAAPAPGSEDFSNLAKSNKSMKEPDLTYCYWRYGSTSAQTWEKANRDPRKVPSNHSGDFLPQLDIDRDDDPLKVGASTLFIAALSKCVLPSEASVAAKL